MINTFDDDLNAINRATNPNEIASAVESSVKNLRRKNLISETQLDEFMREAQNLSSQADAQAKARSLLKTIALSVGVPAIGLKLYF